MAKKRINPKTTATSPLAYTKLLTDLKEQIRTAQIKASLSVNQELLKLYWSIGKTLLDQQRKEKWGTKIIEKLSIDLKQSFPGMNGFSPRNLLYMRQFAEAYNNLEITQQPVAQIPWGHNVILLEKLQDLRD